MEQYTCHRQHTCHFVRFQAEGGQVTPVAQELQRCVVAAVLVEIDCSEFDTPL
jgi:hypothetical protein